MEAKIVALLAVLISLTPLLSVASAQSILSLSLTVYEDGYVLVNETILTANYTVLVDVPLLGEHVEGLVALDEKGNVVPTEINPPNVTIYFGNASVVYLSYFTPDLTSKDGPVWTLSLESSIPVRISIPENAVVVDLSDIPLEIRGNTFLMPAGNVSISYMIPMGTTSTTSSTSTVSSTISTPSPSGTSTTSSTSTTPATSGGVTESTTTTTTTTPIPPSTGSGNWKILGVIVVLVMTAVGLYLYLGKSGKEKGEKTAPPTEEALKNFRRKIEAMEGLNDDERGALLFLLENGGKAPQSKIRDALGIPKTTAWRMFKRLEDLGLVRVYRLGRENWVELVLE